jgi:hypothetical protein
MSIEADRKQLLADAHGARSGRLEQRCDSCRSGGRRARAKLALVDPARAREQPSKGRERHSARLSRSALRPRDHPRHGSCCPRALLSAIDGALPAAVFRDSHAGLHVHVALPDVPASAWQAIDAEARALDVGVYPTAACDLEPPKHLELALGFTRLRDDEIREGIERLASAIERAVRR